MHQPLTAPGLSPPLRHWREPAPRPFLRHERATTTLLVGGLTAAHDRLIAAGLRGLGYRAEPLPAPDNAAMRLGMEFGNRGQCNPAYYTVGNLLRFLLRRQAETGATASQMVDGYALVTAGACGPCRFGTYSTEYRKVLHDAGFDRFRILTFQQQEGVSQNGRGDGLRLDFRFFHMLARAVIAGDVLNLLGYRLRPYELEAGSIDRALNLCRSEVERAMARRRSLLAALLRCRRILGRVRVDLLRPKPVVSVIGEFWAMTTEGDGNYAIHRFLEAEGAEVDIQPVTSWILYLIWESRRDRLVRSRLRRHDGGRRGRMGVGAGRTLALLALTDRVIRACFHSFAGAAGLRRYALPDLDEIARLGGDHYDLDVRGGEGHMEVGKLLHFLHDRANHMTISVKPFGCLPSSGVSDGVQARVVALHPEALFLPIETTGESRSAVYSRVQMLLHRARERARGEFAEALRRRGLTESAARARLHPRLTDPFWRPRHRVACTAANAVG